MAATDHALVKQVLAGDRDAFADLVERYAGLIHGIILEKIRRPDEVEDIMQEVFTKAYTDLATLRQPAKFGPWIARIAANLALNWLRRYRVRFESEIDERISVVPVEIRSPDEALEEREVSTLLWEALDRLPPEYQRIVVLYHLEGCTQPDIARFMDISVPTVKWRLYRAQNRLHREIGAIFEQELGYCFRGQRRLKEKVMAALPPVAFFRIEVPIGWNGNWWAWLRLSLTVLGGIGLLGLLGGIGSVVRVPSILQAEHNAAVQGGVRVRLQQVDLPALSVHWQPHRPRAGERVRLEVAGLEEGQEAELHYITDPRFPQDRVAPLRLEEDVWVAEIEAPRDASTVFFYAAPASGEAHVFPDAHFLRRRILQRYRWHFFLGDDRERPVQGAELILADMEEAIGGWLLQYPFAEIVAHLDREIARYPGNLSAYARRWRAKVFQAHFDSHKEIREARQRAVRDQVRREFAALKERFPERPEVLLLTQEIPFDSEQSKRALHEVVERFPEWERADEAAYRATVEFRDFGADRVEALRSFISSFPASHYLDEAYADLLFVLARVDAKEAARTADSLIAGQLQVTYDADRQRQQHYFSSSSVPQTGLLPVGAAYSLRFDMAVRAGDQKAALELARRLGQTRLRDPLPYLYIGERLADRQNRLWRNAFPGMSWYYGAFFRTPKSSMAYPRNLPLALEVLEAGLPALEMDNLLALPGWEYDPDMRQRAERRLEQIESWRACYLYRLGEVHLNAGNCDEAVPFLQEAADYLSAVSYFQHAHSDHKTAAHAALGRAYEGLGEPDRAAQAYIRALSFTYSHAPSEAALARLYGNRDSAHGATDLLQATYLAAPEFRLVDVSGDSVALSQSRANVALIYLSPRFDPLLGTRQQEMDLLQAWEKAFGADGLEILCVQFEDGYREPLAEFAAQENYAFRFLLDDGTMYGKYPAYREGSLFLVDRQGRLRLRKDVYTYRSVGLSVAADSLRIAEKIAELLRQQTRERDPEGEG